MIRLTTEKEVEALVEMSTAAFETDIEVGAAEKGGPPMYSSLDWHHAVLKMSFLYSVIENNELVGGAVIYPNESNPDLIEIGRIFIAPEYFRKGYGRRAMTAIEDLFPLAKGFSLETPLWNKRTFRFYTSLGYKEVKRDQDLIYFEKLR